jgi:ATP phosphoribosyltransferase regulatory subunit
MGRWLLPEGISDVLPHEAQHLERLRRALLDLFASYGYQLVVPPLIEYLDSLLTGTGSDLDLRTFKLVDQLSGRQLGLRADITPQTARIDAHILNRSGVVRLCYAGSVLHTRPLHPLASREPLQVGAELYGHAGTAADAEVQELALRALRLAGIGDIRFDLGHTGVVRAILADDAAAVACAEDLYAALSAKDLPLLRAIAARIAPDTAAALFALVELHGGVETIDTARRRLPQRDQITRALDDLAWLCERAPADQLSIDLADLHGYRYYTGVNFAAYTPGTSGALLRGGRYDDVGRAFGRARAATGFSIDLRDLTRANGVSMVRAIAAPPGGDPALARLIETLRSAGETVVQQLDAHEAMDGFEFDREIRRIDGTWTVVPRAPG